MFQIFDDSTEKDRSAERVSRLRAELKRLRLTGFVVPHTDEYHNEYLPPAAERLAWLTGFTGSAGMAVLLEDKAAIFVDGRYTLQVRDQVDLSLFTPAHLVDNPPDVWLGNHVRSGDRVGFDPWLHSDAGVAKLRKALEKAGAELVAVKRNPLDKVWSDRPAPPRGKIWRHPLKYAGEATPAKLARLAAVLIEKSADAAILTDPASIAWTFNIRGRDVPHTPLPLSFAIVRAHGKAALFIDSQKLTAKLASELGPITELDLPAAFLPALKKLGRGKARVLIDTGASPFAVADALEGAGAVLIRGADPCEYLKAIKNDAEIAGTRAAHLRDGAALCRFLAWLDRNAASGTLDEIAAAEQLEACRRDTGALKDISFDTISGAGPNGAIVHYRVTRSTSRRLEPGTLYLVDSGGQYADGTTDVTRTLAIGTPTAEMRDRFTRVLKGHIAVAASRFPEGTTGAQLDTLARHALWQAGLDYDHGTGHGVGSFLSVHEGPQRISKTGSVKLEPGMVVSNEPGYYKTGAYGIRIENLVLVTPPAAVPGGEKPLLSFETLTLAPIDRHLIEPSLLTATETAWLDAYHARVASEVGPLVDADTGSWLKSATRPLRAAP